MTTTILITKSMINLKAFSEVIAEMTANAVIEYDVDRDYMTSLIKSDIMDILNEKNTEELIEENLLTAEGVRMFSDGEVCGYTADFAEYLNHTIENALDSEWV